MRNRDNGGVGSKVDEIHAEFAVDEPGDDLRSAGDHRPRDNDGVGSDGLDRVGVDRLRHADTGHRGLQDERLAGGEAAAEWEHHDAGEADADDENPALAGAENTRGFRGSVDVDHGEVGDEGGGDRCNEAGELADDLANNRGLVAG